MTKPFDATLNSMIDIVPDQWAVCFAQLAGIPPGPSVVIDTDLATTLQADKVFRIDGACPRPVDFWLSHGIGLSPLALLTDEANADLEGALERFQTCLRDSGAEEKVTKCLLSSSYILCALRYEREQIAEL